MQQIIISFRPYYYFMHSTGENTTALQFNSFYHVVGCPVPPPLQRKMIICLRKGCETTTTRSEVRLHHITAPVGGDASRGGVEVIRRGAECFWGGFFFLEPAARRLACVGDALNNEFTTRAELWTFGEAPVVPQGRSGPESLYAVHTVKLTALAVCCRLRGFLLYTSTPSSRAVGN